ncbi:MAG: hypothetical protein R3330_04680, partial [Saprospiraceae bacterium]|nr:hypothetical protein [Saprospiraceae bacterium]
DYSGSYEMNVDLSGLLGMAMMFDSTATSEEDMFAEMRAGIEELGLEDQLGEMDGIDNVTAEIKDGGVIIWSFDFDNVSALNASFQALNESFMSGDMLNMDGMEVTGQEDGEAAPLPSFTQSGKTISHRTDYDLGDMGMEGLGGGDDEGMMDMFSSMMDYTIEFSFDRKLKDVELTGMDLISRDDKMVRARVDLMSAMKAKYYEIKVRLK